MNIREYFLKIIKEIRFIIKKTFDNFHKFTVLIIFLILFHDFKWQIEKMQRLGKCNSIKLEFNKCVTCRY